MRPMSVCAGGTGDDTPKASRRRVGGPAVAASSLDRDVPMTTRAHLGELRDREACRRAGVRTVQVVSTPALGARRAELDLPGPSERSSDPRGRWAGRAFTGIVLVALAVAAVRMRGTLAEAVDSLLHLPGWAIASVLGIYAGVVLVRGLLQRLTLPGLPLRRGVVLDQVNLAVSNSMPGGAVVGAAARYRIGRSYGQSPAAVAMSLFSVGQAMSMGRWLLVAVVLATTVVAGTAGALDVAVLVAALAALVASGAVCWVVISDSRFSRAAITVGQRIADRAGRRVPRLASREVGPFVDRLRAQGAWLLRERGVGILLAGAAVTLGGAAIVATVVLALDGPAGPGAFEIVRVYLLVRVAAAFSPTPGNVGVVEGALVAGLVAAGADPASAVAAVMVYRGLTYVLPIGTGSVLYLSWRRWDRTRPIEGAAGAELDVAGAALPAVVPVLDLPAPAWSPSLVPLATLAVEPSAP
jgi:uncharacterized membrane protein YbhN (UPF0104 family)